MARKHIHCASSVENVTSGIRKSAEVLIFIDIEKAINDGIEFFKSSNGVLLTEGVNGYLSPYYFEKVVQKKN